MQGFSAKLMIRLFSMPTLPKPTSKCRIYCPLPKSVKPGCTELGDLEPGSSESVKAKLKLMKQAKGKLKIDATVTSNDAADSTASETTKVKR